MSSPACLPMRLAGEGGWDGSYGEGRAGQGRKGRREATFRSAASDGYRRIVLRTSYLPQEQMQQHIRKEPWHIPCRLPHPFPYYVSRALAFSRVQSAGAAVGAVVFPIVPAPTDAYSAPGRSRCCAKLKTRNCTSSRYQGFIKAIAGCLTDPASPTCSHRLSVRLLHLASSQIET